MPRRLMMVVMVFLLTTTACLEVCPSRQEGRRITLWEICTIGQSKLVEFTQVGEVAVNTRGQIFISDAYQYAIRRFDAAGAFEARIGKRGKDEGEFISGPYKIDCMNDTLAAVGVGSSTLQFFDAQLKPAGRMSVSGAIVDFCCNREGLVYIASVQRPSRFENTLALFDKRGTLLKNIGLVGGRKDPILDMVSLCVDSDDLLMVAYKFQNRVTIYDRIQNHLTDFTVPSLPDQSPMEVNDGQLRSMPEILLNDIAVDNRGNIFILGGFFSRHPNKDVYVFDYKGQMRTSFEVPDQTGILFIDTNGFLYTREKKRSIIKKYRIEYANF